MNEPHGMLLEDRPSPAEERLPRPDPAVARLRRRLWVERGLFSLALVTVSGSWLGSALFPSVWAVYVDGRPVVAMRDRKAVQELLQRIRTGQSGSPGAQFVQ